MVLAYLAMLAAAPAQCAPVDLALGNLPASYRGKRFREASANFAAAYARACKEGLLKTRPLSPSRRLVLVNAPDANVASIYTSKGRAVLEYWFVTHDGKTHVPTAAELHEAIFCAVHGASEKEQEESGRCLPD
jgi:hypothetical protein